MCMNNEMWRPSSSTSSWPLGKRWRLEINKNTYRNICTGRTHAGCFLTVRRPRDTSCTLLALGPYLKLAVQQLGIVQQTDGALDGRVTGVFAAELHHGTRGAAQQRSQAIHRWRRDLWRLRVNDDVWRRPAEWGMVVGLITYIRRRRRRRRRRFGARGTANVVVLPGTVAAVGARKRYYYTRSRTQRNNRWANTHARAALPQDRRTTKRAITGGSGGTADSWRATTTVLAERTYLHFEARNNGNVKSSETYRHRWLTTIIIIINNNDSMILLSLSASESARSEGRYGERDHDLDGRTVCGGGRTNAVLYAF